jgi:hypothetical protein
MDEAATQSFDDINARRWKVFVSSTSSGLDGLREVAREVISGFTYEGVKCFEPVMMENFGAQAAQAREVCERELRVCDVLVGILGIRYGAHPDDDQTSYTELEYETAVRQRLPRLMLRLEEELAGELEREVPQGDDRADRQQRFRERVGADLVAEMHVRTVEDFREKLARDLKKWVEEYSFTRAMVDHRTEFLDARGRLRGLGKQAGKATLIFGEPGTGKTKLFDALLDDALLQHAYSRLIRATVWLAAGKDEVEQVRAQVSSELDDFAREAGGSRTALPPVLIALHLESGVTSDDGEVISGKDVDPDTLRVLHRLFTWDAPRAVVLAETNNRQAMRRLESDLGWSDGTVITVSDYANVEDALEQMRRDAPDVRDWPEPDTRILAQALGLRPISLFAAAKDIENEARLAPNLVADTIAEQLDAIANEESSPETIADEGPSARKYRALLRNSIDRLSPEASELLRLMTVLHPKPTLFRDEIAVALLNPDDAITIAKADSDEELDPAVRRRRTKTYRLIRELVDRGLLERTPGRDDGKEGSPPLLALHPANVRVINDYLPLTVDMRAQGHARAEAFYRARVGEAVSESYDAHYRIEKGTWWDDVEEWIYHLSHIAGESAQPEARGKAGIAYAALFLDAYWWWDGYVKFDFCDQLLDYAERPRVRAASPEMPEVTRLLAKYRRTGTREYEVVRTETLAQIAGDDQAPDAGEGDSASEGEGDSASEAAALLSILKELCGCLGITELNALFTSAAAVAATLEHEPTPDATRLHLLGLLCLFVAGGHWSGASAPGEQGELALAAAEACYRQAESYFLEEKDDWDVAWTHSMIGQVVSERGGDPDPLWDEAADGASGESDIELLAQIERLRGDYLWDNDELEEALRHHGRAVFYGVALQVTSNLDAGADVYTQAFYRELRLHAVKLLAEPLLRDQEASPGDRVAEAGRRLEAMLGEWGGHWKPKQGPLDLAFRSASRETVETSADAIADAAFPPGPGDAVLGKPDSGYYREVDDLIEKTRAQPWIRGLDRWTERRKRKPNARQEKP